MSFITDKGVVGSSARGHYLPLLTSCVDIISLLAQGATSLLPKPEPSYQAPVNIYSVVISTETRTKVLANIALENTSLSTLDMCLKNDPEVVEAAVLRDPKELQHATLYLRTHRAFLLRLAERSDKPLNPSHISPTLQEDTQFMDKLSSIKLNRCTEALVNRSLTEAIEDLELEALVTKLRPKIVTTDPDQCTSALVIISLIKACQELKTEIIAYKSPDQEEKKHSFLPQERKKSR